MCNVPSSSRAFPKPEQCPDNRNHAESWDVRPLPAIHTFGISVHIFRHLWGPAFGRLVRHLAKGSYGRIWPIWEEVTPPQTLSLYRRRNQCGCRMPLQVPQTPPTARNSLPYICCRVARRQRGKSPAPNLNPTVGARASRLCHLAKPPPTFCLHFLIAGLGCVLSHCTHRCHPLLDLDLHVGFQ